MMIINFNPRTREGCDSNLIDDNRIAGLDFNPRTREGCDAKSGLETIRSFVFQSTHP